ncbi:MAG TPA: VCBS repeat-containing protein, partial [Pyrinomonadaceae bacterium]|nr:VCBS repeat-containing protein [Pyrinomonadaceae bacterium]
MIRLALTVVLLLSFLFSAGMAQTVQTPVQVQDKKQVVVEDKKEVVRKVVKDSGPVRFTDITASAGITFKHVASPDKKYIVESMSGGVAFFDYDNDGDLDIYLVNSLTVDLVKSKGKTKSDLYRNDGGGKFTEVAAKAGVSDIGWGMGVAVGDYNNDSFEDLYITCLGPDRLFKNNGNG